MCGNVTSIVSRDGMSRAPVVRFERASRAHEVKVWLEEEENYRLIMDAFNSTSRWARQLVTLQVTFDTSVYTYTISTLRQLHWLPVEARISYKLCSSMYRVVDGSALTYLTELCQPCSDIRLRSTSRGDFIVPRSNHQLSNSSFSVAAPSAWNRLPSHIRTSSTYTLFLTRLKTHLFAESLLWHCDAVVFSLYFWCPRALDVGRHSKFMLIDWLIDSVIEASHPRLIACI